MTAAEVIPPRAPARLNDKERPDTHYMRAAAGVLRSASARRGAFTVTGRLALLLAKQRTPQDECGAWDARALRDNTARALAEIDTLMLRVEAGYMRQARGSEP
jgi:hypothetical protein